MAGAKAAVAVAHLILIIAYHVLMEGTDYRDLGGKYSMSGTVRAWNGGSCTGWKLWATRSPCNPQPRQLKEKAIFRPVPHAPVGHHRVMKRGCVGDRLPSGGRRHRPPHAWCREPVDPCGLGDPKAPLTVAPSREARTADSTSVGAPAAARSIFKAGRAVIGALVSPGVERRSSMRRALLSVLLMAAALAFIAAGLCGLRQHPVAAFPAFSEPAELRSVGGVLRATITAATQEAELGGQPFSATVYNGTLVGPTLRLRPGDRLELTLVNALAEPTNLHFHGLHVSPVGEADNVFREVAAGTTARYVIDIPMTQSPGTFWYHSHQHHLSYEQVQGGLSGLIIIDGLTALLPPELRGIEQRSFALKDFVVASDPSAPTIRTVNGQINPTLSIAPGETQLWHLANIGPELFYELALPGSVFHVIAEDGVPVWQTWDAETLVLPSGKRFDVLVQGGRPGTVPLQGLSYHQGCVACPEVTLATLTVAGAAEQSTVLPTGLVAPRHLSAADVDRRPRSSSPPTTPGESTPSMARYLTRRESTRWYGWEMSRSGRYAMWMMTSILSTSTSTISRSSQSMVNRTTRLAGRIR